MIRIMHKKFLLTDVVGFDSMYDFLGTVFTFKENTVIPFLSLILTFSFAGIGNFIDKAIYSPSLAVLILFSVTIADTVLGASASVNEGEGLSANKLGRAFVRFAVQVMFITFLFQLSVIYVFIPKEIVDLLLLIFTLSTFWSAITNANKLGIVTDEQYIVLQRIVSMKILLERFIKKEK